MAENEGSPAVGVETRMVLPVPDPFDFRATCMGHGWIVLAPNRWIESIGTFQRVEELSSGEVVRLRVQQPDPRHVAVTVWSAEQLGERERGEVAHRVVMILRLDEDLSEFERRCDLNPRWRVRVPRGGGRLLRSPTVFEDVVKTICTTNTTWAQTRAMVERLVKTLGKPYPLQPEDKSFPTPQRIAAFGAERLRAEIRSVYAEWGKWKYLAYWFDPAGGSAPSRSICTEVDQT